MADSDLKFQVKSGGQFLNILYWDINQKIGVDGRGACQGVKPTTTNFLWNIQNAPGNPGWSLFQVEISGLYLNVLNNSMNIGAPTGQNALANKNSAPDNFLWKIVPAPNNPGWSLIQVKSSGQYLNIQDAAQNNGAPACQGEPDLNNIPPNYLWQEVTANSKPVNINLQIDCASVYAQPAGEILNPLASSLLTFTDDNNGSMETSGDETTFRSFVNPGSTVKWTASTLPGQNNEYSVTIDSMVYDPNTGTGDVFHIAGITKGNGFITAPVDWTALGPAEGDNEYYTIHFTIDPKGGPNAGSPKSYWVDPRIKVQPKYS